jgi:hypothetical protein
VLNKLRDRLWVPHQVLTECWRNRESKSVRHHHSTKAKETSTALDRAQRSAQDAVDRWVKDVRLKEGEEVAQQIETGLKVLGEALTGCGRRSRGRRGGMHWQVRLRRTLTRF